jgi:hypothetical protein
MALLLFLSVDRAQSQVLCNAVTERKSAIFAREWNDLVLSVVSDVRTAAVSDAGTAAPILHDRYFVAPEIRVVGRNIADPSEP